MRVRVAKKVIRRSAWTFGWLFHHRGSTYQRALHREDVAYRLWYRGGFRPCRPKWDPRPGRPDGERAAA